MKAERREAITIALALVPGLLPRNRLFAFYKDNPDAKIARRRASALRHLAMQLASGAEDVRLVPRGDAFVLAYRMASMHASRRASLSATEAACVRYLVEKSGSELEREGQQNALALAPDRSALDRALAHLDDEHSLARLEASG